MKSEQADDGAVPAARSQTQGDTVSLFECVQTLSHSILAEQLARCGGSMYLVAPNVVRSNVQRLRDSMQSVYSCSDVAYSYKTNYCSELINAARGAAALSEVVSFDEYQYARSLNVQPEQIIYNGVGKCPDELGRVLIQPMTVIIDSLQELRVVAEMSSSIDVRARLGLRVCPILDFIKTPSRFGIDLMDDEQLRMVKDVLANDGLKIQGLHLHHSGDRSVASFTARLRHLKTSADRLALKELQFIDLGGGLASGMPEELRKKLSYTTDSLEKYGESIAQAMHAEFGADGPQLILEPGTGVLADAGIFATTVLDTKRAGGQSFAVIDGTLFAVDPLRSSVPPLVHRVSFPDSTDTSEVAGPVIIGGNSCMEIDIIHGCFPHALQKGDILIVAQKGSYAACMSTPFIHGIPALAAIDQHGNFKVLRERTDSQLIGMLNDVDQQVSAHGSQIP